MNTERSSGILLHPTSLPGKYGIGTLGKEAYRFIDFLVRARQQLWQILPLGPTGYADSPYQCFSSRAGNPLLIDPELLVKDKLLKETDFSLLGKSVENRVDFGQVISLKYPVLQLAYENFIDQLTHPLQGDIHDFVEENAGWLDDYALFMSMKMHFDQKPWYAWDKPLKMREENAIAPFRKSLSKQIGFQKFMQYIFFRQWNAVKDYAHQNNIRIIGDIPLYVSMDSVDAWTDTDLFQFDASKNPIAVGGVPPDYFSETGQLWGNPLYRWDALREQGYKWWIERIKANLVLYDIIRIDHFRGLAAFWAVPYGEKTAVKGEWVNCPGNELFEAIQAELGNIPIIAEDLGVMTVDVESLRDKFRLPGMKILQFAFDSAEANDFIPHSFIKNCVVYTGTHDNETLMGWVKSAKQEDLRYMLDYINSDGKEIHWDMIRVALASVANIAIIPMQDFLGLGNEGRMNLPGTTSDNWMWRALPDDFSKDITDRLAHMTSLYGRTRVSKQKK